MSGDMRSNFFNALADLDSLGAAEDNNLRDALNKALFKRQEGRDDEFGTGKAAPRTPLEFTLARLQGELSEAQDAQTRHRVRAKITRELILAAREQNGEKVDEDAPLEAISAASGERALIDVDGDEIR